MTAKPDPIGPARFQIYFRERFPLHQHAPLVAAFSFCAVSYAAHLRNVDWPTFSSFAVAFPVCLLFFLQLRIADEFKDKEEDARWRPYRAVPRGLVKLKELGWIFAAAAGLQLILILSLDVRLIWILFAAWSYLIAMSMEFGAREWLKARPIVYLLSHMLIMPIVDFTATACDWLPENQHPPAGLGFFLATSFLNGLVIELGRKIRLPKDEEAGVETYSALWGRTKALKIWQYLLFTCAVFATASLSMVNAPLFSYLFLSAAAILCSFAGKRVETVSGVWTLLLYLILGLSR
jgi:4-hydroxybenzoate polyprenyltransferase